MMSRVFLLISALGGCVALPEVPAGTCGNHVIEPGEDCDGFPDPSHAASLSCEQCRYVCEPSSVISCPSGWGCGIDGRCRRGTGRFEPASSEPDVFPTSSLVAGDRDGDIAWELLASGDARLGTLTAANRQLSHTIVPTLTSGALATADLNGDGLAEVLRPSFQGGIQGSVGVRGTAPRPMLSLGDFDVDQTTPGEQPASPFTKLVTVRLDNGRVVPYAALPQSTGLAWLDLSRALRGAPTPTGIDGDPSTLLQPAVGNIDTAVLKRGDEIAIAYRGGTSIYVRRPNFDAFLTITLPGPLAAAPIFGDVDADGLVDLVAPLEGATAAVAYGTGTSLAATATLNSTFTSQPPAPCGSGTSPAVGAVPRLIADLDGNGRSDYLTPDGIVLGLANGSYCRASVLDLSAALSAVVLDANGDGRTDVAIASGS